MNVQCTLSGSLPFSLFFKFFQLYDYGLKLKIVWFPIIFDGGDSESLFSEGHMQISQPGGEV